MESRQYSLCREVMGRLETARVLDGLIVVGSWCMVLYQDYFRHTDYLPSIRTRDLDLLVPLPQRFAGKVDLPSMLQGLGFVRNFHGDAGLITFQHPDLILEFLVPERGRGTSTPTAVPALGVNAQALRFLDFLVEDAIRVEFQGIVVRVPHPVNFALHKLIIAARRKSDKGERDRAQAVQVLHTLVNCGEAGKIVARFASLPGKWQKAIRGAVADLGEDGLLALL